jgi:hypothetical protein
VTIAPPAGRKRAALTLALLTPVIAELALGSTPPHLAFLVLLWLPVYGAGVLLIREVTRRRGGGWPSLVLLGIAYELVEDGLGLQALTSPHLYGAAGWAPRLFGLNTAYWEANAAYHVVFSVLIPIALTDLIFPAHRDRAYLRRGGLVAVAAGAVLGVLLLRVSVPPAEDPGYTAPWWATTGCVLAVVVLVVLALAVLPRRTSRPVTAPAQARTIGGIPAAPVAGGIPAAPVAGAYAAVAAFGFMALIFPFGGAERPAFTHGSWVLLPMAAAAVIALGSLWLVGRWSRTAGWDDHHRLWLIGGALLAHTAFGVIGVVDTLVDRLGLVVIAMLEAALVVALQREIHSGDRTDPRDAVQAPGPLQDGVHCARSGHDPGGRSSAD